MKFIHGDIGAMLYVANLKKTEIARILGVTRGAVSKWTNRMPVYANAYMVLYIESKMISDAEIIRRMAEWQKNQN